MLAVANFIHAPLWAITLAAAGVLVAGNLWVHYARPWVVAQRQRRRTAGGGVGGSTGSSAPDSGPEASGSAATGAAAGSSSAADPEPARSSGGAAAEQVASPGAVKGRGVGVLQHTGAGDAETAAAEGPAIELVVLAHHGDAAGGVTGAEAAGGKLSSGDVQLHDGGNLRRRTSAGMDGGGGGQDGIVPLAELGATADAASASYIETVCTCSMSRFLLKR